MRTNTLDDHAGWNRERSWSLQAERSRSLEVYGLKDTASIHLRCPTFSFNIKGADPKSVADYLWKKDAITVFTQDFYSRALKTYNVPTAIRASLVHCNTVREVETFLAALANTLEHFKVT